MKNNGNNNGNKLTLSGVIKVLIAAAAAIIILFLIWFYRDKIKAWIASLRFVASGSAKTMDEFAKLGDTNRDGVIDSLDQKAIEDALNSKPGDANWNVSADLNGDGIVDVLDAQILSKHYGWRYANWIAQ
jgi:hypothetical protein